MWKIFNKLFGWDYINVRYPNSTRLDETVRVHVDGDGNPYYWYSSTAESINKELDNITWLTCPSSKYIYPDKTEGYVIK